MSLVGDVLVWLGDKAHYRGDDGVLHRLAVHLEVTGAAVGIACLVALPLAVWLGHRRGRLGSIVVSAANATRALPVFGVLIVLASTSLGTTNKSAVAGLALFAVPPLLTNAYIGLRDVDPDVVEAARGNGMSGLQVLRAVELPLAVPLIAAGLRTSVVQVIATATLSAYVGGGGLGQFINEGFGRGDQVETAAGGVLVAALALTAELVLAGVQRLVTPRTATRP